MDQTADLAKVDLLYSSHARGIVRRVGCLTM
jgi:hypothetical protein